MQTREYRFWPYMLLPPIVYMCVCSLTSHARAWRVARRQPPRRCHRKRRCLSGGSRARVVGHGHALTAEKTERAADYPPTYRTVYKQCTAVSKLRAAAAARPN